MWCCALNNLPTRNNLRKRGLQGHTSCSKCGAEEIIKHILFQCETIVEVWDMCPWLAPLGSPSGSVSTFKESLQHSFARVNLPPVGSSASLFPWICWGLWINRNLHTFENKQTPPPEILSRATALLREWEAAQPSSSDRSRTLSPQLPT